MEGSSGSSLVMPNFFTKLMTGMGPTLSIKFTVIELTEFAKAAFNVISLPVNVPVEFRGHQG